jgi:four helix bundle protein
MQIEPSDARHGSCAVGGMKTTPTDLFPFQRLNVYRAAHQLVVVVQKGGIRDGELRDQATRAAKSVLLRLAEGLPHDGAGMRQKYFREAQGSLYELVAAVDVAGALGVLDDETVGEAMRLAHDVKRMLRGLMK